MNDINSNSKMATYLARPGLFYTADIPTVVIKDKNVCRADDIKVICGNLAFGTVLTDGVGFISQSISRDIAFDFLKVDKILSALQIRWRGVTGVVMVVQHHSELLRGKKMLIRPSMESVKLEKLMTFMSALLGTLLFKICISVKKSSHCLHLSWTRITLRWNSYRPDSGTQIDPRISMLATKGKEEYRHIVLMLY